MRSASTSSTLSPGARSFAMAEMIRRRSSRMKRRCIFRPGIVFSHSWQCRYTFAFSIRCITSAGGGEASLYLRRAPDSAAATETVIPRLAFTTPAQVGPDKSLPSSRQHPQSCRRLAEAKGVVLVGVHLYGRPGICDSSGCFNESPRGGLLAVLKRFLKTSLSLSVACFENMPASPARAAMP